MKENENLSAKMHGLCVELEKCLNLLLSETSYLKIASMTDNYLNMLNSSGIMIIRLSDYVLLLQKLISKNIDIMRELNIPKDTGIVLRKQFCDSNAQIIQLSNAITNYLYFLKFNILN